MGTIYKQKNSRFYWIKYYRHKKPIRESSGSTSYKYAENLLKEREWKISKGRSPGTNMEKILFGELIGDYLNYYKMNQSGELKRAKQIVEHLKTFSGFDENECVVDITTDRIKAYIVHRQGQKTKSKKPPANGTINRELSGLKIMFNMVYNNKPPKVERVIKIPMLKKALPPLKFL